MTNSKKNLSSLIRIKDMPQSLGVSRSTIRRMIDAGEINLTVMHTRCVGITEQERDRIFEAANARGRARKPKSKLMPKAQRMARATASAAESSSI